MNSPLTLTLLGALIALSVGVIGFCVGMAVGLRRVQQVNEQWYTLLASERQRYDEVLRRRSGGGGGSGGNISRPGGGSGPRSRPLSGPAAHAIHPPYPRRPA